MRKLLLFVALLLVIAPAALIAQDRPVIEAETMALFDSEDANQGVAVDANYFYAVTNSRISKHDKETGERVAQWDGEEEGLILHLDSGVVVVGLLYASHSNWPEWPMTSSVEVWDTETMEHVDTFSFGIQLGSFTWLDRYDGYWWGTFANYDRIQRGQQTPYGFTYNTQMVKMDDEFQVLEQWAYPRDLLQNFEIMSNSGGSWGPDGYLYITGHDFPRVYVVQLPEAGSLLNWVATITVPDIEGQGIAWDRSTDERVLYGIYRPARQVVQTLIPRVEDMIQPQIAGRVLTGDLLD
ncbi:MAG: hypothetical protein GYB67_07740 [Chloroflexi bacterium]|nr:hypothetical protein [Chloroflexota bacterium]